MKPKHFLSIIGLTGFFAIVFDITDFKTAYYILKPLTSLLIVMLPFCFSTLTVKSYSFYIATGLICCLIGDVILLFEAFFIYGLSVFLCGHLFFLRAFVKQQGFKWPFLPGLLLLLFSILIVFLCYDNLEGFLIPVLLYIGVILLMSWQGIALQQNKKQTHFRFIGWAVGLFLISDAFIALNKFYFSFKYSGLLILSTYWIAISLIALTAIRKD
ncbi:MAG: lysoplasmalogenase [Flavobacteriaceae bacterium]